MPKKSELDGEELYYSAVRHSESVLEKYIEKFDFPFPFMISAHLLSSKKLKNMSRRKLTNLCKKLHSPWEITNKYSELMERVGLSYRDALRESKEFNSNLNGICIEKLKENFGSRNGALEGMDFSLYIGEIREIDEVSFNEFCEKWGGMTIVYAALVVIITNLAFDVWKQHYMWIDNLTYYVTNGEMKPYQPLSKPTSQIIPEVAGELADETIDKFGDCVNNIFDKINLIRSPHYFSVSLVNAAAEISEFMVLIMLSDTQGSYVTYSNIKNSILYRNNLGKRSKAAKKGHQNTAKSKFKEEIAYKLWKEWQEDETLYKNQTAYFSDLNTLYLQDNQNNQPISNPTLFGWVKDFKNR